MKTMRALLLLLLLGATPASAGWVCYTPDPVDGMDTWYGSSYYTGGMPNDSSLKVGGWGDIYTSAFRFNLSGLPVSATQAAFYLYAFPASGTPAALNWWRPNRNWQEATARLSNPVDQTFYLGSTTAPPTSGWYGIDITSLYNSWRTGSLLYLNYGLKVTPTANNNNFSFFYSSDYTGNTSLRPTLCVNSASVESRLVLKWPLGSNNTGRAVGNGYHWNDNWNNTYCGGLIKKHNGTDYSATAGWPVYAAEDGFVRRIATTSTNNWGGFMAIEHNGLSGKWTTLYWHISPVSGISEGDFVPKGMQIATVQDISVFGHGTHFHFGVRKQPYSSPVSVAGGLPQTDCGGYPAFPASFVNPEDTSIVLFQ
jgi:murein DD-endopeptidase MepM/ murein hydrolase activator NlpD